MNQKEFQQIVQQTFNSAEKLLVVKGGEYAGSDDRLANFKRGATLTGATPLQVAFVYASKHYDSIATFVRDSALGKERVRSEPMEGRFDDMINYMILMKALYIESQANRPKQYAEDQIHPESLLERTANY